jgi:glycosyltransferase involved in cell wall biosynthesis
MEAVLGAIGALEAADHPVAALRAGFRLLSAVEAARNRERLVWVLICRDAYATDYLYRVFALLALGRIGGPEALAELTRTVECDEANLAAYAAWAMDGQVAVAAVPPLVTLLGSGDGFARMQAQIALESMAPDGLEAAVATCDLMHLAVDARQTGEARVAALDVLGRVAPADAYGDMLLRVARDRCEPREVRAAAVRLLGVWNVATALPLLERLAGGAGGKALVLAAAEALAGVGDPRALWTLTWLAESDPDGPVGDAARLSLASRRRRTVRRDAGLTIAQVVMQGTIDAGLASAGAGDGGGLATITVNLTRAFDRHPDVARVVTVGRARGADRLSDPLSDRTAILRVPFGPDTHLPASDMWPHLSRIERGLERALQGEGAIDALHLRFADAGTWAAARWAARQDVPIYFTLAPDPYSTIHAAVAGGLLDRGSFGAADAREHYIFRAGVLEWMVQNAAGLALLPRPDWERDAREFFDLDITRDPRVAIVAEGVDPVETRRPADAGEMASLAELLRGAEAPFSGRGLSSERLGLPALVSVARMHPIKGLPRLVEAWASSDALRTAFNLVLVGGDLRRPTDIERRTRGEIEEIVRLHPDAAGGLVLLGNLPNPTVTRLLAALRRGVPGLVAPNAIYVCASDKEEFGLAILEAMAAGLLVVAPGVGGPATYLTDGEAGSLHLPAVPGSLAAAVERAAAVRADSLRRERMVARLRATVAQHYSIDRMADGLVALYRRRDVASRTA